MSKYYYNLGGGLGDALISYLEDPFLRRLPDIKQKNPKFELCIISQVHNNGVEDLFWRHPVVDKHLHVVQLPQFKGYEKFDESLIPNGFLRYSDFPNVMSYKLSEPVFNIDDNEKRLLDSIFTGEPVIVIQPFAGLSNRDAFNNESLTNFVRKVKGKKVIIGRNAPRVCVNRPEKIDIDDPSCINLIDMVGIRFTYHLLKNANAFIGGHSSIILLSWFLDKPTVCILPFPDQKQHWDSLDPKYKKGVKRGNTLITSFNTRGNRCPEDYDYCSLDYGIISGWLDKWL